MVHKVGRGSISLQRRFEASDILDLSGSVYIHDPSAAILDEHITGELEWMQAAHNGDLEQILRCTRYGRDHISKTAYRTGAIFGPLETITVDWRFVKSRFKRGRKGGDQGSRSHCAFRISRIMLRQRVAPIRCSRLNIAFLRLCPTRCKSRASSTRSDDSRPTDIGIIGGGITGLATAFHAAKRYPSSNITLFECSNRFGGVIDSPTLHFQDDTSAVCEMGVRTLRATASRSIVTFDLVRTTALLLALKFIA